MKKKYINSSIKKSVCLLLKFNEKFSDFEDIERIIRALGRERKTAQFYPEEYILSVLSQY